SRGQYGRGGKDHHQAQRRFRAGAQTGALRDNRGPVRRFATAGWTTRDQVAVTGTAPLLPTPVQARVAHSPVSRSSVILRLGPGMVTSRFRIAGLVLLVAPPGRAQPPTLRGNGQSLRQG